MVAAFAVHEVPTRLWTPFGVQYSVRAHVGGVFASLDPPAIRLQRLRVVKEWVTAGGSRVKPKFVKRRSLRQRKSNNCSKLLSNSKLGFVRRLARD